MPNNLVEHGRGCEGAYTNGSFQYCTVGVGTDYVGSLNGSVCTFMCAPSLAEARL